jgi:hypothetical protein
MVVTSTGRVWRVQQWHASSPSWPLLACALGSCGIVRHCIADDDGNARYEWALRKAVQSAMSSAAAGQAFDAMKPFPFLRMHNAGKSFMRD